LTAGVFLFSLAVQTLAQPTIPREQIPPDSLQKVVAEIKRLYSNDPMERGQAASSLGWMGDSAQAAIPHLLAMFHDYSVGCAYPNPFCAMPDYSDCPAKRAALDLARIGGAAVDTLLSLYNTGDEHEKLWSVYALAQIKEARTNVALKQFLESSYLFYEPHYGWMGYYEEKPPIFRISYSMVLREVIEELGERRDTSAVTLLIDIACDTASSLREEAVQALGKVGDRRAVEPLIRLLDQNSLSGWTASALAHINDPRAIKPLLSHLKDATGNYNGSVMVALGDFKSTEALNAIIPALQSPNINDRHCAVIAIGACGTSRSLEARRPIAIGRAAAVEPLIEALHEPVPEVRHDVMRALGSIGDKRAIVPLYNIMQNRNAPDSWWAQDALIDITGEDFRQYDGGRDKWIEWQRKWIPGFQKSVTDQHDSVKVSTPNITIVEDARLPRYARIEVEVNNQTGHYLDCRWLSCQYEESFTIDPNRSNKVLVYSWGAEIQNIDSITEMPLVISFSKSTFSETLLIEMDWTQAVRTDIAPSEDWRIEPQYPNPFSSVSSVTIFAAAPSVVDLLLFDKEGQFVKSVLHSDSLYGFKNSVLDPINLPSGVYFLRLYVNGQPMDTSKVIIMK